MKATKTMTTLAAAAMVSVIGLAYAQNSDSTLDPATTPQAPQSTVVTDQMPAQTPAPDTLVAPADQAAPADQMAPAADPAQAGTTSSAAGANAANTAAPADTTTAPSYNSNPEPAAAPVERAPRTDRN